MEYGKRNIMEGEESFRSLPRSHAYDFVGSYIGRCEIGIFPGKDRLFNQMGGGCSVFHRQVFA